MTRLKFPRRERTRTMRPQFEQLEGRELLSAASIIPGELIVSFKPGVTHAETVFLSETTLTDTMPARQAMPAVPSLNGVAPMIPATMAP